MSREGLSNLGYDICDCHVHFGNCSLTNKSISLSKTVEYKRDTKGFLVFPLDFCYSNDNEELTKNLAKYDVNALALARIQFGYSETSILSILEKHNIVGLKFHPSFDGVNINDNYYDNILKHLAMHNKIALVHCGRRSIPASYKHVLLRARKYKDIHFILAHMGGNDLLISTNAVKEAESLGNVYFDTSNCRTPYIIENAVDVLGSERILFGSDYPWGSLLSNAYTIIDAEIPDSDKRQILANNFMRFFGRFKK